MGKFRIKKSQRLVVIFVRTVRRRWIRFRVGNRNPAKVGPVVEELVNRDDPRGTIYLNRLIPRMDKKSLAGTIDQLKEHSGPRPAWHFLMARQLGLDASDIPISTELINAIYQEALAALQAESSSPATSLAAWEFYASRLTDENRLQVDEITTLIPGRSDC